jgi:hypothetical protein
MKLQRYIVHLGLIRTNSNKANINIEELLSLARTTLYSLIKSGVHGTIGLRGSALFYVFRLLLGWLQTEDILLQLLFYLVMLAIC